MNSPNPTPPDARETLRNLIAEKLYQTQQVAPCDHDELFKDFGIVCPRHLADAVMELFPEAGVEDWLIGTLPTSSGEVDIREQIRRPHMPVTHQRYVLRTAPVELSAPQPAEETRR